jgi:hypothetical protein
LPQIFTLNCLSYFVDEDSSGGFKLTLSQVDPLNFAVDLLDLNKIGSIPNKCFTEKGWRAYSRVRSLVNELGMWESVRVFSAGYEALQMMRDDVISLDSGNINFYRRFSSQQHNQDYLAAVALASQLKDLDAEGAVSSIPVP